MANRRYSNGVSNGHLHNSSSSLQNEDLASLLMESAEMVKQGNRDNPVLNRTLEAFLLYMEHPTNSASSAVQKPSGPPPTVGGMLGKMMGMGSDSAVAHEPGKTMEQKAATSRKNAERVKSDLKQSEEARANRNASGFFSFPPIPGFTDDVKQQPEQQQQQPTSGAGDDPKAASATVSAAASKPQQEKEKSSGSPTSGGRAEFQRPSNPKSPLVANGWIEQQRRSKMRTVWKDVLASLVEGRKKGEETTLWIQRQVINPQTNQTELEALHQIPVKWLEEVTQFDYSTDNRWSLKVYNLQEEFIFRCPKDGEAATNWVTTLLAAKEGRLKRKKIVKKADWESGNMSASMTSNGVKRTGAVAAGKEKDKIQFPFDEEEKKSDPMTPLQQTRSEGSQSPDPPASAAAATKTHRSVKELRAIAHGAGIQTAGMERGELESVVEQILAAQNQPPQARRATTPPPPKAADQDAELKRRLHEEKERLRVEKERVEHERRVKEEQKRRAAEEEARRIAEEEERRFAEEEERRRAAEEAVRLQQEEMERIQAEKRRQEAEAAEAEAARQAAEEATRQAAQEEEHRQRIAERVRKQQEAERRRREEEERARLEKERIEREEAEHQRRVLEMQERERQEAIRKQQEAYAQQQRAWQEQHAQQAEAARLQQLKEEQEARAREEELRKRRQAEQWAQSQQQQAQQQQWHAHQQQQQQQAYHQQQQQQAYHQHHAHGSPPPQPQAHGYHPQHPHATPPPQQQQQHYPQHGGYYQQPQQQQQHHTPPPQQQQHHSPPPTGGAPPPQSPINQKYAKMAASDEATANAQIKHGLLVHWALQPPMLQALKPIEALITTVHTVFPPSFGVAGHEYFKKWKAVVFDDISTGAPQNRVDDDKLNKAVRKLRFFLHPDKLPKDLTADQTFLIKLLWDVTNDAFEEHKKKEEDLGWIRS